MAYESKLYIVDKHEHHDNNGGVSWTYLQKITEFYMSVVDKELLDVFQGNAIGDDWELYADDGNTIIKEDMYGDKLTYASVDDVLSVAEKCENHCHYRRYVPLIAYLKAIKENCERDNWENLIVIHYGY